MQQVVQTCQGLPLLLDDRRVCMRNRLVDLGDHALLVLPDRTRIPPADDENIRLCTLALARDEPAVVMAFAGELLHDAHRGARPIAGLPTIDHAPVADCDLSQRGEGHPPRDRAGNAAAQERDRRACRPEAPHQRDDEQQRKTERERGAPEDGAGPPHACQCVRRGHADCRGQHGQRQHQRRRAMPGLDRKGEQNTQRLCTEQVYQQAEYGHDPAEYDGIAPDFTFQLADAATLQCQCGTRCHHIAQSHDHRIGDQR